ncbi:MAG: PAS domain S-box protein [Bacteroidota bacterium]
MNSLNNQPSGEIDFKYIFDISPGLIFILDKDNNILKANRELAKRLDTTPEKLAGTKCFICMHLSDQPSASCIMPIMLQDGQEHSAEMFVSNLNGWFTITVKPLFDKDGNVSGSMHIAYDVSEKKASEEALRKSEDRYKKAQEVGHVGSWEYDLNERVFWCSEEGKKIFGLDLETNHFTAGQLLRRVVEKERVSHALISLVEHNEPYDIEFDITTSDRLVMITINSVAELIRDVNGNPVRVTGVLRDITESKRVEKALREEQYLLSVLMDNIPDHIYFKDLESRFFRNNRAHVESFGLTDPGELIGKSDFDFFVRDGALQQFSDEQEVIRTGMSVNKEECTIRNDESVNWYHVTKMPLRSSDGKIIGTFGISRDITSRKTMEEELGLKNEELLKTNAEKDKFFSIIAHDLRSPFNSFLGFTRMMVEDLPSLRLDEIQTIALTMQKSATNLYNLLENLLEWSRLQRGITSFNPVRFTGKPVIVENMQLIQESAIKKGIMLVLDIPDNLETFADENMLGGIVRNLVTNAVKFTPRGGVVTVRAHRVPNRGVGFSVTDTGIGMDQQLIGNLFKLDVNTSRQGTDHESSSGLGLMICKEFIEKHQGEMNIESIPGKGSVFSFMLPDPPESHPIP